MSLVTDYIASFGMQGIAWALYTGWYRLVDARGWRGWHIDD